MAGWGRVRCALVIALLVLAAGAYGGDDFDAMFDEAVIGG